MLLNVLCEHIYPPELTHKLSLLFITLWFASLARTLLNSKNDNWRPCLWTTYIFRVLMKYDFCHLGFWSYPWFKRVFLCLWPAKNLVLWTSVILFYMLGFIFSSLKSCIRLLCITYHSKQNTYGPKLKYSLEWSSTQLQCEKQSPTRSVPGLGLPPGCSLPFLLKINRKFSSLVPAFLYIFIPK